LRSGANVVSSLKTKIVIGTAASVRRPMMCPRAMRIRSRFATIDFVAESRALL
jgi:hypothetical protein